MTYQVLVVTNMWPNEADPSFGIFVKEQMESLRPLGVEYDLVFVNGRKSRWNYLRGIFQVRKQLRTKRYDLIHAHFGLAGWVARCQLRTPLLTSFWGDDVLGRPRRDGSITPMGRFFQITSFILARLSSQVIVLSRGMRRLLKLDSAEVIPCGIDLEFFRPMDRDEARLRTGLDPHKKYVLFAYNPEEPRKRFDLVEAAVAKAREQIPELELLLVRKRPHSEVPLYMNAADAVVMASMLESGPYVTKEAMATNLPVITVNVGDAVDVIHESDGNYIVPRDVNAIADKVVEVCRRGQRSQGRARLASCTIEATAKRILEVYSRVVHP